MTLAGRVIFAVIVSAVAGRLKVDIVSPTPCLKSANKECDCLYQALFNESISFVAAARAVGGESVDFKLSWTLDMHRKLQGKPLRHCQMSYCTTGRACTHSCNITDNMTGDASLEEYVILAAPYDRRVKDASKTVCIQVNNTAELSFRSYPGREVTSEDGEVTLLYEASGYPMPSLYELLCENLAPTIRADGVFQRVNFPEGKTVCHAVADNRFLKARSAPTTIVVTRERFPESNASSSISALTIQDYRTRVVVGAVVCVGLVVVLVIVSPMIYRNLRGKPGNARTSVINILNDRSQHTICIHNGLAVETYGPNSAIVLNDGRDWLLGAQATGDTYFWAGAGNQAARPCTFASDIDEPVGTTLHSPGT